VGQSVKDVPKHSKHHEGRADGNPRFHAAAPLVQAVIDVQCGDQKDEGIDQPVHPGAESFFPIPLFVINPTHKATAPARFISE
jgi:hypothetical protein